MYRYLSIHSCGFSEKWFFFSFFFSFILFSFLTIVAHSSVYSVQKKALWIQLKYHNKHALGCYGGSLDSGKKVCFAPAWECVFKGLFKVNDAPVGEHIAQMFARTSPLRCPVLSQSHKDRLTGLEPEIPDQNSARDLKSVRPTKEPVESTLVSVVIKAEQASFCNDYCHSDVRLFSLHNLISKVFHFKVSFLSNKCYSCHVSFQFIRCFFCFF